MRASSADLNQLAERFDELRPHLVAVGYRLTGSRADAEDAIQEAWLRLAGLPEPKRAEIDDLKGWLTTVTGRICLDRLKSAAVRRERYIGEWLPEPIVTPLGGAEAEDPLAAAVRDEGVRMAAMVVLDKLEPNQRVAFVLHDAFSVPFGEIAEILGVSPAAARQYASRARRAVDDAAPPPRTPQREQLALLEKLMTALSTGNATAIAEVLHPDVVLVGDADGKARTTARIIAGPDKVARFLNGLAQRVYEPGAITTARPVEVNGDVGVYLPPSPARESYPGLDAHVTSFAVRDGKVVAIYDMANPDKLTDLPVG